MKKYKVLYEDVQIGIYSIYDNGYVDYVVEEEAIKKLKNQGFDVLPMIGNSYKGYGMPFFDNRIKNCSRFPGRKIGYQTDSVELIEIKEDY